MYVKSGINHSNNLHEYGELGRVCPHHNYRGSKSMSPATLYTSWMLSGHKQMGFEIYQCYM